METIVTIWGLYGGYTGIIGYILGLHRDNGAENGTYYLGFTVIADEQPVNQELGSLTRRGSCCPHVATMTLGPHPCRSTFCLKGLTCRAQGPVACA